MGPCEPHVRARDYNRFTIPATDFSGNSAALLLVPELKACAELLPFPVLHSIMERVVRYEV